MKQKRINAAVLKQNGFRVKRWKDDHMPFPEYILENKQMGIEVYGAGPEVDINVQHGWINVPNCKTEADLKALLKLFGFTGK